MGVGERVSVLAGSRSRLTKHGIDMGGGDEAAEAVTKEVAAAPLYPGTAQH